MTQETQQGRNSKIRGMMPAEEAREKRSFVLMGLERIKKDYLLCDDKLEHCKPISV